MAKQNPVIALFVREILPAVIIIVAATVGQRLTHYLMNTEGK